MQSLVRYVLVVLISVSVHRDANAQPNCKKGIPCGNSCIAANKTCRIGSPSPRIEQATVGKADSTKAPDSGDWVGSSRGTAYYKAGCSGARRLAPANLIYFKSEDDAKKAGYRRSASRGC